MEDLLTVSFAGNYEDDHSAICIARKTGDHIEVLKMELDEQADILYRLLTEQMTKAEIKGETR